MSTTTQEVINKGLALLKSTKQKADYAVNDYITVPGFKDYEQNSKDVLRSKKTGKVQQIPAGKKKYLIFNTAGNRKPVSIEEINALIGPRTSPTTNSTKPKKVRKPRAEKVELTQERINELNSLPTVQTILAEKNKKHKKCMLLNNAGLNTDEIIAVLGTPRGATLRNIWFYTSGKKTL